MQELTPEQIKEEEREQAAKAAKEKELSEAVG